jgi:hypothetical protein
MTHTIHRRGDRESLERDYIVLVREYGIPEKTREAVRILADHNPVGLIKRRKEIPLRYMKNWEGGMDTKALVDNTEPPTYVSGVYAEQGDVEGVVRDLVEAGLGLPITISGIVEDVFEICKKTGTGPHTVMLSVETVGRTELLPDDKILEITTMCGHGLVSQHLVKHLIDRVRKRRMTAEEAGFELGKQCICNSFNHIRAAKLIEDYIGTQR